jgi:hypothetical protein
MRGLEYSAFGRVPSSGNIIGKETEMAKKKVNACRKKARESDAVSWVQRVNLPSETRHPGREAGMEEENLWNRGKRMTDHRGDTTRAPYQYSSRAHPIPRTGPPMPGNAFESTQEELRDGGLRRRRLVS